MASLGLLELSPSLGEDDDLVVGHVPGQQPALLLHVQEPLDRCVQVALLQPLLRPWSGSQENGAATATEGKVAPPSTTGFREKCLLATSQRGNSWRLR